MILYIGADHRGFKLKETLKQFLHDSGYTVNDMGNAQYDENDDYPDLIMSAAKKVAENTRNNRGIVLGGSGQGEAIVANRHKGVRATVYAARSLDLELVKLMREHNDSNVLSLGARFVPEEDANQVVKAWLETPFSGEERHKRRIAKIDP